MAPVVEVYAPGNTPPASVEDWAFFGHLTVSQQAALSEFRQVLLDNTSTKGNLATKDDQTLLRYMRARQFDVKKAMKMVQGDLEWRQEIAGKRFTKDMFPNVLTALDKRLLRMSGLDRQGRPVIVLQLSQFFPRKMSDVMEVVNFFIYYVGFFQSYVEGLGYYEFAAIADMKGWSLSENFSLPVVQVLAGLLQDHFPETLRYAFVVNNPFAFSAAWSLISPFLEERVKAKIHVFGKRLDKLKEYIAPEVLEQDFGGVKAELYDSPDAMVLPLLQPNKVAVVGSPYEPIAWEDELQKAKSSMAIAEGGEEESLARDFEPQTPAIASDKPTPLQKKKSVRKVIARMFSAKTELVVNSTPTASPAAVATAAAVAAAAAEQRPMEVIQPNARPRIAVFGGTGKTGRETILSLLDQHQCDVSAFVRIHGSNLAPDLVQRSQTQNPNGGNLTVFVGEFGSLLDLERVVEGCDAAIVAIGVPPALTGSSGAEFLPLAMEKILVAMGKFNVRRLVLVSSAHASQAWWDAGAGLFANVTKPMYWKNHYQYVAQMETLVTSAPFMQYTIVRPGTLLDDTVALPAAATKIEEGFVFPDTGPGEITRLALSKFLVSEALDAKCESRYCKCGVAIGRA
ncbi:hypothetical protein BASA81_010724 [Batrachochytrium salamandrivorans]|nr:hypothetical protein BASA81_010724 [Batrachochytrium salamandrivorans]